MVNAARTLIHTIDNLSHNIEAQRRMIEAERIFRSKALYTDTGPDRHTPLLSLHPATDFGATLAKLVVSMHWLARPGADRGGGISRRPA